MKSSHCQMTVSGIVKSLDGNVKSIQPSHIEFELNEITSPETVLTAIKKVSYNVNEN